MSMKLSAEDYFENLNFSDAFGKSAPKRIPMGRIIEKLDEYFSYNDYLSAERHIKYWAEEAKLCNDDASLLSLYNELMGLYRKLSRESDAFEYVEKSLELSKNKEFENSILLGTTYLNIGTVCKAFSNPEKAIEFYSKALDNYKMNLKENDTRFAGLYNNLALALVDVKEFDKARNLYEKAIDIMKNSENGELDCAISYLNLANLEQAQFGLLEAESRINELLDIAKELLDTDTIQKDGYYAFVCEKCAPTYSYYGYFLYAQELRKRAKDIYERD